MTRQQKLDASARKKGYSSYYAYRNAQAKAEGYANYTAKRRTRTAQLAEERFIPQITPDRPTEVTLLEREHLDVFNPANDRTRNLRMAYRQASRSTTDIALEAARVGYSKKGHPRHESLPRTAVDHISELDNKVMDFYQNDFPKVYAEGARRANPNWQPSHADNQRILDLTKEGAGSLAANNAAAKRSAKKVIPALIDENPATAVKKASFRPIKGSRFANGAQLGFENYAEMALRANTARAYNLGFIHNTSDDNLLQVSDGSGCGWFSHDDPEQASGKIVTKDEALAHPIAHPNCVRGFSQAPKGSKPTKGLLRKLAGGITREQLMRSAAQEAVSLGVQLASDKKIRAAAYRSIARSKTSFLQYKLNLETVARLYNYGWKTRAASLGNVTDISTHLPPMVNPLRVADDVMAWMDDFADGVDMPPHVLQILGIPEEQALKVIGDRMGDFTTFYNYEFKQGQMVPFPGRRMERGFGTPGPKLHTVPERMATQEFGGSGGGGGGGGDDGGGKGGPESIREVVVRQAREAFTNWVFGNVIPQGQQIRYAAALVREAHDVGIVDMAHREIASQFFSLYERVPKGKFVRLTFPDIGGDSMGFLDRPRRLTLELPKIAKVTRTSIKDRGIINHLSLNPNGMLRAGFSKDPETGFITPTFRLIPPGPLHMLTRVNRGIKGNITSLSGEVRLITKPVPFVDSLTFRFNLNMRKLGITSLEDARKITLADLRKFSAEDLRGVSMAANLRVRGFNVWDIARTYRISWEEAMKLWALTDKQLGDLAGDLKAFSSRKKFLAIEGGGDITGVPVPKPHLRIVDPLTGDAASPFTTGSLAQRIEVPRSIKSVPARRDYIAKRLTQAERDRVAALRLGGDFSTVRHLKDVDKLSWDQISVNMNLSLNKVKKLYKEGTSGQVTRIGPRPTTPVLSPKGTINATRQFPERTIPGPPLPAKEPPKVPVKFKNPPKGKQPAPRKVVPEITEERPALEGHEARTALERQFGINPLHQSDNEIQRQALDDWNQPHIYRHVNGFLRDLDPQPDFTTGEFITKEEAAELTAKLDALMQPTPVRILTHRISQPDAFGVGGIEDLVPGMRFGDPGFNATSIESFDKPDIRRANPIRMKIDVPKGTDATWIGGIEDELLLARDLTYQITKVDKVREIVHVRVVPKAAPPKPKVTAKTKNAKLPTKVAPKIAKSAPKVAPKKAAPVAKAAKKVAPKTPTKVPGKKIEVLPPKQAEAKILKDAEAMDHFQEKYGPRPLQERREFIDREEDLSGGILHPDHEVIEALEHYQAEGHEDINGILRNPNSFMERTETALGDPLDTQALSKLGRQIQAIDEEMTPTDITVQVYREVKTKVAFGIDHPSKITPGTRMGDPAFMSTSVTDEILPEDVSNFTGTFTPMEFIVPKGTRAIWLGDWEKELLLDRGLTLEVVRWDNVRKRLVMKVVPK